MLIYTQYTRKDSLNSSSIRFYNVYSKKKRKNPKKKLGGRAGTPEKNHGFCLIHKPFMLYLVS